MVTETASMEGRPKFTKKHIALLSIGLFILTIFMILSDFNSVIEVMLASDKINFFLGFTSMFVGVIFYTISWTLLLNSSGIKLKFLRAFEGVWISVFFNIIVPTASISGEVFRIWYAVKETNSGYGNAAATVFIHRILCFIPFMLGSILGLIYFLIAYNLPTYLSTILILISTVISFGFLLLLMLWIKPKITIKIVFKIAGLIEKLVYKKNPSRLRDSLQKVFEEFEFSLKMLGYRRRPLFLSLIFAIFFWLLDVAVAYFVFQSLNYPIPFALIVAVYTIGITVQIVPVGIPGMIGIVETIMSGLYTLAGIPLSISVAATMMIRFIMMWLEALIGGIAFILYTRRR
ncbi:MAG: flippase-like domain-containing protein [Nitrososphaeria archaeon]|nr:flippase-like domain-containing protein [Nitrososphaeria archaeon]